MKAVTEFPNHLINKGLALKNSLSAAGKTPEEVQASLGETFKYEAEKLKYFVAALDVGAANTKDLRRVMVMTLAEGETAPAKAVQVEEHYYVPEFIVLTTAKPEAARDAKGGRGGRGGPGGKGKSGPKSSPWGMSPEELAAKKGGKAPQA